MLAWENFLRLQEKELGAEIVQNWLRTLKVLTYDACNLYLEAKDTFQVNWFEEHIRERVQSILVNNNQKKIHVHLSLANSTETAPRKKFVKKAQDNLEAPKFLITFDELDPSCTFSNFIMNDANVFAYKLFCKTAGYDPDLDRVIPEKMELSNFNPIYCHGATGSGKTHLLMAIANSLRSVGRIVNYVRAETFMEHVVTAIRAGEMSSFRQSYRNAEVLIIDDVHSFARKTATQEELFHTFNELHASGMQIILSASCTPSELTFIEPRLVSRFEWGVVIPMDLPSKDSLKAIVKAKASAFNSVVPSHVIDLLIDLFPSSCKAAVRGLEALILRSHLSEKNGTTNKLTIPAVRNYLADLIEEEQKAALTPQKVIHIVTEFFGIPEEEVFGKSQSRDCVLPRQIAMYFCRTELEMPFMRIGELFSRDHSTVMSSIKSIQKGLDSNDESITSACHAIHKRFKL
jgi:chromosomal replication initiator protein